MGDSGSWVVHGSKLLGHVFAVQEGTPWSYMIPITQVLDDIQKSLLAYSIELPIQTNQVKVPSLCPKDGRSHASLVAFGVNACPKCKQDLRSFESSQERELSPDRTYVRKDLFVGPRGFSRDEEDSSASPSDSYESSDRSDFSVTASTVPTSIYTSTADERSGRAYKASTSTMKRKPGRGYETTQHVPVLVGATVSWDEYWRISTPRTYNGPKSPSMLLEAAVDGDEPRMSHILLADMINTNATCVLDLKRPINDSVRTSRITLVTPSLNGALRSVVRWDPTINQRHHRILVNEPYAVLVGHLDKLVEYASEIRGTHVAEKSVVQGPGDEEQPTSAQPRNQSQIADVQALVDFIKLFMLEAQVATEFERHTRNACVFRNLWLLFHPGITVYANARDPKGMGAYVVTSVQTDPSILRPLWQSDVPYIIHMWRLNYDGQFVTRQRCSVAIDYFEGERDITSLKVFPCEYLDRADGGKTRCELEDRGRRWYQLLRGGAAHYSGELPAEPEMVRLSLP